MGWLTKQLPPQPPVATQSRQIPPCGYCLISIEQEDRWYSEGDERWFLLQSYLDKVKKRPWIILWEMKMYKSKRYKTCGEDAFKRWRWRSGDLMGDKVTLWSSAAPCSQKRNTFQNTDWIAPCKVKINSTASVMKKIGGKKQFRMQIFV